VDGVEEVWRGADWADVGRGRKLTRRFGEESSQDVFRFFRVPLVHIEVVVALGRVDQLARVAIQHFPPGEEGLIVRVFFQDLLLQAAEGPLALAVEQGHVDVENTEETVGHVLDAGCLAAGRPRHALRDARRLQRLAAEELLLNP
jgi:hypothetical protein